MLKLKSLHHIINPNIGGTPMKACPCNSGKHYVECCDPFISGKSFPKTPEQLMRSRYSAYTLINIDYIARTMRGPALKDFNKRETENWARQVTWLGLEVLNAGMKEHNGFVEFIAKYTNHGTAEQIHERSEFHCKDGKWYYVNGKNPKTASIPVQIANKIGRNDACSCGSGKKFKKCCNKN